MVKFINNLKLKYSQANIIWRCCFLKKWSKYHFLLLNKPVINKISFVQYFQLFIKYRVIDKSINSACFENNYHINYHINEILF